VTRTQYVSLVVVALLAGLVGGAISERLFSSGLAVAQQRAKGVNAEEFLLLDKSGKARAGLGLDANGEVGLVLTSKDGGKQLHLSPDDRLALKLVGREGKVLWSAP
jgi:hypothetical protein